VQADVDVRVGERATLRAPPLHLRLHL